MFEIKTTYYYNNMAMKKLFRSLLTLALSAPLLSGCSLPSFFSNLFSNLPEETKEVSGLDARSYTRSAELNSTYTFDGKVYVVYKDTTDKEVTEYCTFDPLDTTKVGSSMLKIKYETKKVIYTHKVSISVYDPADKGDLKSIRVTLNNDTVEKGKSFTFDGTVEAEYSKAGYIAVNNSDCTFSPINTSTVGDRTLTVTYQGKTANVTIHVIAKPTAISGSAIEVGVDSSKKIELSFTPSDTTEKECTYKSNNTSVATVDANGNVTGKTAGQSTTITVTSKASPSVSTTVNVTVTETQNDAWTILLYLCGSSLESGGEYGISYGGQATDDLKEILSVSGQPDDVNFVVQTGGSDQWLSDLGISSSYNQRYHVANNQLVKDNNKVYNSYQSMGAASTLQDFIEWGIDTYPADKYGLILWNHGGGLEGVCYDEKSNDDALTNERIKTAVSTALSHKGLSKMEFIGFDACLMQMMEIAEFNSPYFKYQVGSQELENGTGWDYDTWVDDLYAKKDTEVILKAIVDGFIESNGGVNATGEWYQGEYYYADQTLSYLDLSQMSAFKTAWEEMAVQVKANITNDNKDDFNDNLIDKVKCFSEDEKERFCEFDCGDFLDLLAKDDTFKPASSYITNAQSALSNLVKYNLTQKEYAANAHGLSFCFKKSYASSTYSNFTNWVSLTNTVGGYSSSSSSGGGGGWPNW